MRILVTGAGGFIGHWLVNRLKTDGHWVRGVDLKYPEFQQTDADDFKILDLRDYNNCVKAVGDVDQIYNLAADMGGIGYITSNLASIARNNTLINTNMVHAAATCIGVRYLYTSSACVYAQSKQHDADVTPLVEEDAYPADPEPGYGWEKLYAEQMAEYYRRDNNLDIRIVRFHNVYGPLGTYKGGKEKSPAALCRKIAKALPGGIIEIWGDGEQTRSYMHITDCVEGLVRIMAAPYVGPLNLGTDELVSINRLATIISNIAGKRVHFKHDLSAPQGVRGRNSNNNRLRSHLGWEPKIQLTEGLISTHNWVNAQVQNNLRRP